MKAKLRLYTPHAVQLAVHNSKARFKVVCTGRQSGKSTLCNQDMAKNAWERPGTRYAFISPIFAQAKEQYRRQLYALSNSGIVARKSDSELQIELINGSVMEYLSGDNPHSIRGKTLNGVYIDEVRDQDPSLWQEVVRPMISTTQGFAVFVSTPRGFDSFYDLAQKEISDKDWQTFRAPSTCNPLFTQAEFESAKKDMGESEFKQEILAEFIDLYSGSAYMNFGAYNIREVNPFSIGTNLYSSYLPICIGLDFNVSPMGWIIGQEHMGSSFWFDEIFMKRTHTQEAAIELIGRLKQMDLKAKPMVRICGDATGRASKTSAAGRTDYSILFEMLRDAGITYEDLTPESNPLVKDRVNIVNMKLKSATGESRIFIHPKCTHLIKDMQRVSWKQGAQMILDQTTDNTLTHISDAMGYFVCATTEVGGQSPGLLRIIHRA